MAAEAAGPARALQLLKRLSRELTAVDLGTRVDEARGPPDPAAFLRDYVGQSKPLVIRGGAAHWPALAKWDPAYLAAAAGAAVVSVDVTPNGRGDAVTEIAGPDGAPGLCFCTPHQRTASLAEFLDFFFSSRCPAPGAPPEVPYLQHQNSNLTQELPQLLELGDVEPQLPWAAEAFGAAPDAVNLWIGDRRAATTFHKDAYENIYCVVAGTKVFHLLPPCDGYRLALTRLPVAGYEPDGAGRLGPVIKGGRPVTWSPVDPCPPDRAAAALEHPLFFDASLPAPLVAEVGPGDVLYLPSLWYHYVAQREDPRAGQDGWVVAVNYWYDMQWGTRYAHFKLTEALAADAGLVPRPPSSSGSSSGGSEGGEDSSGGSSGGDGSSRGSSDGGGAAAVRREGV